MSPQVETKRLTAVIVTDTLNKIECIPVTEFAKELSSNRQRVRLQAFI